MNKIIYDPEGTSFLTVNSPNYEKRHHMQSYAEAGMKKRESAENH